MENVPNVPSEAGNTNKLPKSKQVCYLKWCFTHNLDLEKWNKEDENKFMVPLIEKLQKICRYYIISLEQGQENGRFHLQGYTEFNNKKRLDCVKKIINNKTHWEKTKGNRNQNIEYITKEPFETWTWEKPIKPEYTDEELELLKPEQFYEYQKQIVEKVQLKPDKRIIDWIYSVGGAKGKTELCKYLIMKHDALLINGSNKDIMCQILGPKGDKKAKKIYVFNLAKCKNKISYEALEALKDGLICSSKYEGGSKVIPRPHVIVFSNFIPDLNKMSAGRFNIINVDDITCAPVAHQPAANTALSGAIENRASAVKLSRPAASPSRFKDSLSDSSNDYSSDDDDDFIVEF